jgi:hypothetical protein
MLEAAAICSLKILFVWAAMQPGMILFPLRWVLEGMISFLPVRVMLWVRKPLFDCLFCMSSVWGFLFSIDQASLSFGYLVFLFTVGGINYLVETGIVALTKEEVPDEG